MFGGGAGDADRSCGYPCGHLCAPGFLAVLGDMGQLYGHDGLSAVPVHRQEAGQEHPQAGEHTLLACSCKERLRRWAPMPLSSPAQVYSWFLSVYRVSVFIGSSGYVLLIAEIFGLGLLLRPFVPASTAITCLWYGLYFGILGRDCAEVVTDRMATVLGTGRRMAVSVRDCGICGCELGDAREGGRGDASIQLNCKHLFHQECIQVGACSFCVVCCTANHQTRRLNRALVLLFQGWTLVGKKDVCPTCHEKVDLRNLYADRPWLTGNLSW